MRRALGECGRPGPSSGACHGYRGRVPDDFLIARNPEEGSALPYLLRIPLGPDGVVLKTRETWPRIAKVYCHRAAGWPADPEIVEAHAVRACTRRGAAIDLLLERGSLNRSQFVLTRVRGGREAIFWQTARTTKQARPGVALPTARAQALRDLTIVVDSHERYAWKFTHQQVGTRTGPLRAGDYGVEHDGDLLATVERKSLADLVGTLTGGRMRYLLADLARVPHAAVVVEDRYSSVFELERVRPAVVADLLAECQVSYPQVPIHFCQTRALAQEWTYRFLAAAAQEALSRVDSDAQVLTLPSAAPATTSEIRAWARAVGMAVSDRGRVAAQVRAAYERADGRVE